MLSRTFKSECSSPESGLFSKLKINGLKWLAASALVLGSVGSVQSASVLIDDFSEQQLPPAFGGTGGVQLLVPGTAFPYTDEGTLNGFSNVVGGSRDIQASVTSGLQFQSIQAFVNGGIYSHAQNPGLTGDSTISWDGDNDPLVLDHTGLGGVDLTDGNTQDALELRILFADLNATIEVEVFTDAANSSITKLYVYTQLESQFQPDRQRNGQQFSGSG